MTAIAALIQGKPAHAGRRLYDEAANWFFAEDITLKYGSMTVDDFNDFILNDWDYVGDWARRVELNVQANQKANGIPIRTIQGAIDAGEYVA